MRHLGFGLFCAAALGLIGFFAYSLFTQPDNTVRASCRDAVAYAAVDVDAWRMIASSCNDREQLALIKEFESKGLSADDIKRSRGELPAA